MKAQSIKINNEINKKNMPKNLFNECLNGFNNQDYTKYQLPKLNK